MSTPHRWHVSRAVSDDARTSARTHSKQARTNDSAALPALSESSPSDDGPRDALSPLTSDGLTTRPGTLTARRRPGALLGLPLYADLSSAVRCAAHSEEPPARGTPVGPERPDRNSPTGSVTDAPSRTLGNPPWIQCRSRHRSSAQCRHVHWLLITATAASARLFALAVCCCAYG